MTENRRFHRVGHDARATLSHAWMVLACTMEDMSLNGCLVRLDEQRELDADNVYLLSVHLSISLHIEMKVRLAHQEGKLVGFRCVEIDPDSIGQLRRLVELNLGDSVLVERDFQELIRL